MQPNTLEKIVLSILKEKDLTLTIGQLTHKVRQRTGVFGELRKQVRTAVEHLFTAEKIDRVYMGHHRSKLTGVSLTPKWGYRIPREKWYYGG